MDDKMGTYESVFRASVDDPEAFWLDAARAIDWQTAPTKALDARPPFYRWFPDGELNICAQRAGPPRRGRARRPERR